VSYSSSSSSSSGDGFNGSAFFNLDKKPMDFRRTVKEQKKVEKFNNKLTVFMKNVEEEKANEKKAE
jgi:hypothetical protein